MPAQELRKSAISHLAATGFDPVFGARPVKRVIQREIETPLARSLLKAEFEVGRGWAGQGRAGAMRQIPILEGWVGSVGKDMQRSGQRMTQSVRRHVKRLT